MLFKKITAIFSLVSLPLLGLTSLAQGNTSDEDTFEDTPHFAISNGNEGDFSRPISRMASETTKTTYRFMTTNDNFAHGALGTLAKTGTDLGKTFGLSLERLSQNEKGQLSLSLGSDLYATSANVNGNTRNANGDHYVSGAEKTYIQADYRKNININTPAKIKYVRLMTEVGRVKHSGGFIAESLQSAVHSAFSEKTYEYLPGGADEFYVSGKLGFGQENTLYNKNNLHISSTYEGGVQFGTYDAKDNALYVEGSLTAQYKKLVLSNHATINTAGNFKVGTDITMPVSKSLSIILGAALEQDTLMHEFPAKKDEPQMQYNMGLEYNF